LRHGSCFGLVTATKARLASRSMAGEGWVPHRAEAEGHKEGRVPFDARVGFPAAPTSTTPFPLLAVSEYPRRRRRTAWGRPPVPRHRDGRLGSGRTEAGREGKMPGEVGPQDRRRPAGRLGHRDRRRDARDGERPPPRDDPSLEPLVRRAREGDETARNALWKRLIPTVRGTATSLVPEDEAEDVVQEVALTMWDALASFRGEASLRHWISRITERKCMEVHTRKERRMKVLQDVARQSPGEPTVRSTSRLAEASERRRLVRRCFLLLSPADRSVLYFRDLRNLSHRQVAEQLGCSEEAARLRCHRARDNLRQALRRRGGGGRTGKKYRGGGGSSKSPFRGQECPFRRAPAAGIGPAANFFQIFPVTFWGRRPTSKVGGRLRWTDRSRSIALRPVRSQRGNWMGRWGRTVSGAGRRPVPSKTTSVLRMRNRGAVHGL